MTVYVDDANIQASVQNGSRTHTSKWCHMTADSTEELITLAKRIGLRTSWMQRVGKPGEHFDLTVSKRRLAVAAGAVEITWREGVEQMRAQAKGLPFDLAALRAGGIPVRVTEGDGRVPLPHHYGMTTSELDSYGDRA